QASVKRHLPRLIEHIRAGHISPREVITHRIPLEEVADAYDIFVNKRDNCIKPVLVPPSARDAARAPAHWRRPWLPAPRSPRTPPRLDVPWQDPPQQQPMTVEVLKSVERPEHSRTFGTRLPPRGLSGAMRRAAFRRSENDIGHWLMLVAADRVDVAESMVREL